ncbi:MAG: N-acetylglucosamine-6-phosphate deacetylase [Planctomycetales bacterium]|nr:N-acetylglucosamine-6-phosphate deacetylase [Planctomycetales bacterium]
MNEPLVGAYYDLQINGFMGVDFNSCGTTSEDIIRAHDAMQAEGVVGALPTIITHSVDNMSTCIENLVRAKPFCPLFKGLHLEGPFVSSKPGYIGAHPAQHAKGSDIESLKRLIDVGGGWIRLVTLSPEVDIRGELTRQCVDQGIVVAAGHTDASLQELDRCLDVGLSLFTHWGNGCPQQLHRHDNILLRALNRAERLRFTLIADGFHIPKMLFENLLRCLPIEKLAVVSDAISAAGLGPGTYGLGEKQVTIGPDRACRDPSGQNFAGAASSMRDADDWLAKTMGLPFSTRQQLLLDNPKNWVVN